MKLNQYFSRSEFACKCGCGYDTVDVELLRLLTTIREHFGKPVVVTSGCRCESHNSSVGGSPKSQHLYGKAADIKVKGVEPKEVYKFICKYMPDRGGFGLYSSWVHVDSRDTKSRWGE